jgi:hypothetical protein
LRAFSGKYSRCASAAPPPTRPSTSPGVDREDAPVCHCRRSARCPAAALLGLLHLQWQRLTTAPSPSPAAAPSNGGAFSLPRICFALTWGGGGLLPCPSLIWVSRPMSPFSMRNNYGGDRGTTDMWVPLSMSMTCRSCFIVLMTCRSHLTVLNGLGYRSHRQSQVKANLGSAPLVCLFL